MKFNEIWQQLCNKEPALSKEETTVEFKSKNLKALLRQVYEQGEKQGFEAGKKDGQDGHGWIFGSR